MKFSDAIPSKYLTAANLGDKQVRLVMRNVEIDTMPDGKKVPVLYFTKARKGLCLNKTNGLVISSAYGDEMSNWTGKEVILFSMKVQFKQDIVNAIRIEIPMPVRTAAPAPIVVEDEMPDDTADEFGADPDDEIPL
jgi:hypothetical protein